MNPLTFWKLWKIGSDILLGATATCALTSCLSDKPAMASPPPSPPPITRPAPPVRRSGSEYRIEARITEHNRCMVSASVNGRAPLPMLADSGAPDVWFPVGDLPKLGIARSSLSFWMDAREGNIARVTLPELRIGDFVARDVQAIVSDREDMRLLGMSVLKLGHMEIQGETCVLTFPRNTETRSATRATGYRESGARASVGNSGSLTGFFEDATADASARLGRKPTAQELGEEAQRKLGWK
jgi:clan AA aspartic protease (TIGR02281 family)